MLTVAKEKTRLEKMEFWADFEDSVVRRGIILEAEESIRTFNWIS